MKAGRKIRVLETIRQGMVGGGETHVFELAKNMNKAVYEPIVLSFTEGAMVDALRELGIKTYVIYTEKAFDRKVWERVKQLLLDEQIDLVHAHGTRACSNVFKASNDLKIPLLYTIHGWSFHQDQNFIVKTLRKLSEKYLTSRANLNICVSNSNQKDGIEWGMKRSIVIYNAVDLVRFNPDRELTNLRKSFNIPDDKFVVGYIVRFTFQKDPFTLIKAMAKVVAQNNNIVLLAVGSGELKGDAVKLVHELQIEDSVYFEDFRSDVPEVLNSIDLYCLPSLWEGFPIGVIEAMAMRKTVVVTPVDGTKELVTHNHDGILVPFSNPDALADAILHIYHRPELNERYAKNAHRLINEKFEISKMVAAIEQTYNDVLANKRF